MRGRVVCWPCKVFRLPVGLLLFLRCHLFLACLRLLLISISSTSTSWEEISLDWFPSVASSTDTLSMLALVATFSNWNFQKYSPGLWDKDILWGHYSRTNWCLCLAVSFKPSDNNKTQVYPLGLSYWIFISNGQVYDIWKQKLPLIGWPYLSDRGPKPLWTPHLACETNSVIQWKRALWPRDQWKIF